VTGWFARPVLHVSNVEASLRFYVDRLGFTIPWQFEGVAQVDRDGCALILSEHWPEKVGKGLMFISLNVEPETKEAYVAALDDLRVELEARGATVKDGHWGYRLLVVEDLDGNQLYSTIQRSRSSQVPLRAASDLGQVAARQSTLRRRRLRAPRRTAPQQKTPASRTNFLAMARNIPIESRARHRLEKRSWRRQSERPRTRSAGHGVRGQDGHGDDEHKKRQRR
jgi:catechol 2,3-dioxygenase-like lactoylglutathione lyase family enzyme